MKRIFVSLAVVILSACGSASILDSIDKVKQTDVEQAMAILTDQQDPAALSCAVFLSNTRAIVHRILAYPTSGPLSRIAKRRALKTLHAKLEPEFERACAPVLMDEKLRAVRFAALFGR